MDKDMMAAGIFEGLVGTIVTLLTGVVGFLHKRTTVRIDHVEEQIIASVREIDAKVGRDDVKEIVADKLAPIHVSLKEIKKDLDSIVKDVRFLAREQRHD